MKSELIKNEKVDTKLPALYEHVETGLIVLFKYRRQGTVVANPVENDREIGDHNNQWYDCQDRQKWRRLPSGSQVILTQEGVNT